FFFQAEDGIRDKLVTGVQTCALPISLQSIDPTRNIEKFKISEYANENNVNADITIKLLTTQDPNYSGFTKPTIVENKMKQASIRSEERRVGKECRYRWSQ